MARLKLDPSNPNANLKAVGDRLYKLAQSGPKTRKRSENNLIGLFDPADQPKIRFAYDTATDIHVVVPFLGGLSTKARAVKGLDEFGNEALGFVVIFGCGV